MAVFAETDGPLRARQLGQALDRPILAKHTEGIRAKLTRLVDRSILAEAEPGLFTQPRRSLLTVTRPARLPQPQHQI
ncbi:hypothetical protein [Streptomyces sp. NPDC058394]|uniref:hypothetical protein n=1 Tax=Streptomyces sp. NPDC058394 TaxID=3346477 RepID=UPI003658D38C